MKLSKKKSEHKEKLVEDSDEVTQTYLNYVSNLLPSLFSNFILIIQGLTNANGLYPHKAQISNEFNLSAVSKKSMLACHGYTFEDFPDAFGMHSFTDRANSIGTWITFSLYGRLAIDLFTSKNCCYKLPKFELN